MSMIVQHELMLVLPALAEASDSLHSGSKGVLFQVLTHELPSPQSLDATDLDDSATLVNGQALNLATGMSQHAATFG